LKKLLPAGLSLINQFLLIDGQQVSLFYYDPSIDDDGIYITSKTRIDDIIDQVVAGHRMLLNRRNWSK